MSKPFQEVKNKEYFKDSYFLYEIISVLKSVEEVKSFMKDILTKSELRMLKRRWHIADLLDQGLDIRTVAQKTKTSTGTVTRVKRTLEDGHGGIKLALKRMAESIVKKRERYMKSKKLVRGSKFVRGWFS